MGPITYATCDLTNLAALREWPVLSTVGDLAWGMVMAERESRISAADATGGGYQRSVAHNPSTIQYLVVWADTGDKGTRGWDILVHRVARRAHGLRPSAPLVSA